MNNGVAWRLQLHPHRPITPLRKSHTLGSASFSELLHGRTTGKLSTVKAFVESPLHTTADLMLGHTTADLMVGHLPRKARTMDDGAGAQPSPSPSPLKELLDGTWGSSWNQQLAVSSCSIDTISRPEPEPEPEPEPRRCAEPPSHSESAAAEEPQTHTVGVSSRPLRSLIGQTAAAAPHSEHADASVQGEADEEGEGENSAGEEGEGSACTASVSDATSDASTHRSKEAVKGTLPWSTGRHHAIRVKRRHSRSNSSALSRTQSSSKLDTLSEQVALVVSLQHDILARLSKVERTLERNELMTGSFV
jgi:hypothetical protein